MLKLLAIKVLSKVGVRILEGFLNEEAVIELVGVGLHKLKDSTENDVDDRFVELYDRYVTKKDGK